MINYKSVFYESYPYQDMIVYILLGAILILYLILEINKYMEFKTRIAIINSPEGETARITPVSSLIKYISEILSAHHFAEFVYGFTLVRGNPKIFTLPVIQENIVKYVSNRYRDYHLDYTQKLSPSDEDAQHLKDFVGELYNKFDVATFVKGKFGIDVQDVDCYPEPQAVITGLSYINNAYYLPLFIETPLRIVKQTVNLAYKIIGFNTEFDSYGLKYYLLDNRKNVSPKGQKFKICVFTHGIGAGVAPYYRFINQLVFYDFVMMIEQPNIAFDHSFPHFPPARDLGISYCNMITKVIDKYVPKGRVPGTKQPYLIDIMGQSYGTVSMSHIMNSDAYKEMIQKFPVNKFHKKLFIDPVCFSYSITKVTNVILSDLLSVVRMKPDDPDVIFTQGITEGFGKNCSDMTQLELTVLKDPSNVLVMCPTNYDTKYNPNYMPGTTIQLQSDPQIQKVNGRYQNLPPIPLNEMPGNKIRIPFIGNLWNWFMNILILILRWLINQQITSLDFLFNFIVKYIAANNSGVLEAAFRVLFPVEAFVDALIDDSTYFVISGMDLFVNANQTIAALQTLKGDDYVKTNVYYRQKAGHVAPVLNYDHMADMFERFEFYPYVELIR